MTHLARAMFGIPVRFNRPGHTVALRPSDGRNAALGSFSDGHPPELTGAMVKLYTLFSVPVTRG